MARPSRNKLKLGDEPSINKLMQEIYADTFNNKVKITRLFTQWGAKIKENGDVAAIGDQIIKLIGADMKNTDQKLVLLKFLKETHDFTKKKNDESDSVGSELSADERARMLKEISESQNKN